MILCPSPASLSLLRDMLTDYERDKLCPSHIKKSCNTLKEMFKEMWSLSNVSYLLLFLLITAASLSRSGGTLCRTSGASSKQPSHWPELSLKAVIGQHTHTHTHTGPALWAGSGAGTVVLRSWQKSFLYFFLSVYLISSAHIYTDFFLNAMV